MKDPRRELRAYRSAATALKRKAKKQGLVCWICREPFDWSLPYHDARAFTADHVVPIATGGSILGPLRPAHRSCNSSRGTADRMERTPTTRTW